MSSPKKGIVSNPGAGSRSKTNNVGEDERPPIRPGKIVCIGRNYLEHARELGNEVPTEPLFFLKPSSSIIANGEMILLAEQSQQVEFEGEIGVVIGTPLTRA